MDIRPPVRAALDAFGGPALVKLPGAAGDFVETSAFWLPSLTSTTPVGEEFARTEQKRFLVIPTEAVLEVPRGTIITFPEFEGQPATDWQVEESDKLDFDCHRCTVIRAQA